MAQAGKHGYQPGLVDLATGQIGREIFPNTALHPRQPRSIAVWHPRGPHQTEVWRWYLVDQEAPSEVKNFLRQYYIRYSGPGDHRTTLPLQLRAGDGL